MKKLLWLTMALALGMGACDDSDDDTATGGSTATGGTGGSAAAGGTGGSGGASSIECGDPALFSATHDACGALDAAGDGQCFCVLGYIWDGDKCEAINGCACQGADCDKLTETPEQCAAAHATCVDSGSFQCGSAMLHELTHDVCDAMDAAGEGLCNCMLGFAWDGSECVGLAGCECVGNDCNQLSETAAECAAAHDTCGATPPDYSCGSAMLYQNPDDICDPMDATAQDPCFCMLGYAWDGSACVVLGGCECVGSDCDGLYETEQECVTAHASCP